MKCIHLALAVFVLAFACALVASERPKNIYKVSHISSAVVGISCPGNGGDPTVITNIDGTLLVSCGDTK